MLIENNIKDETGGSYWNEKVVPLLAENDTKAIISRISLL